MSPRPGSASPIWAGRAGLELTALSVAATFTVAVTGTSVMEPPFPGRAGQPPWAFDAHLSPYLVIALAAVGLLAGTAGLPLPFSAPRRGCPLPVRPLLLGGLLAAVALTLVPPFGSSDPLSYAAYGRILVTGHNPYVVAPDVLARLGDPVARAVQDWKTTPSDYGTVATAGQALASLIGGTSARLTVFVLSVLNLAAFAGTGLILHRLARGDRARQARAVLLWTANPLLLQVLVAGQHVDSQAIFFGVAAVAVFVQVAGRSPRQAFGYAAAAGGLGRLGCRGQDHGGAGRRRAGAGGPAVVPGPRAAPARDRGRPGRGLRGGGRDCAGRRGRGRLPPDRPGQQHGFHRVAVAGHPDSAAPGPARVHRRRHRQSGRRRAGRPAGRAALARIALHEKRSPRPGGILRCRDPGRAGATGGAGRAGRAGPVAGLAAGLAVRAALVRRAGLGAAAADRRVPPGLAAAGPDRGAGRRVPARPGRRGRHPAGPGLAPVGGQDRGDTGHLGHCRGVADHRSTPWDPWCCWGARSRRSGPISLIRPARPGSPTRLGSHAGRECAGGGREGEPMTLPAWVRRPPRWLSLA